MFIKCIYNKVSELSPQTLSSAYEKDFQFYVDKEEIFVVYGMFILDGLIWYLIDKQTMSYPEWFPAPMFDLLDGLLSKYWIYSCEPREQRYIWSFPKLATDRHFYANVVEDEEDARQIYQKYKVLMDVEFPNPSITKSAKILDENWSLCEDCMDAWESNTSDAMIFCPLCNQMMLNPRYKSS